MATCTLHFHSPALAKAASMNVILPESRLGQPPFPVFYLLHGLSDDHTIWTRRTSIERYVAALPLIVACNGPDQDIRVGGDLHRLPAQPRAAISFNSPSESDGPSFRFSASKTSATAVIRPSSGMSSPASPIG